MRTLIGNRRKGTVEDMILIAVIVCVMGFVAMLCYVILVAWGNAPPMAANPQITAEITQAKDSLAVLGNSALFLLMAFGLTAIISAFYTDSHPVFFVFSILTFAIMVMVVSIFSGIFIDLYNSSQLLPVASQFYTMIETVRNFPILAVMIGGLIVLALYIKRQDLRTGGGIA